MGELRVVLFSFILSLIWVIVQQYTTQRHDNDDMRMKADE